MKIFEDWGLRTKDEDNFHSHCHCIAWVVCWQCELPAHLLGNGIVYLNIHFTWVVFWCCSPVPLLLFFRRQPLHSQPSLNIFLETLLEHFLRNSPIFLFFFCWRNIPGTFSFWRNPSRTLSFKRNPPRSYFFGETLLEHIFFGETLLEHFCCCWRNPPTTFF